jgi:hypothetical protein
VVVGGESMELQRTHAREEKGIEMDMQAHGII